MWNLQVLTDTRLNYSDKLVWHLAAYGARPIDIEKLIGMKAHNVSRALSKARGFGHRNAITGDSIPITSDSLTRDSISQMIAKLSQVIACDDDDQRAREHYESSKEDSSTSSSEDVVHSDDDHDDDFASWIYQPDDALALLDPLDDFDSAARLKRFTEVVSPRMWAKPPMIQSRVFPIIHQHPRWNTPTERVTQADLSLICDRGLEWRRRNGGEKGFRFTSEPLDLLKKTDAGRARWQSILLFSEEKEDATTTTESDSAAEVTRLYQEWRSQ